MKEYSRRKADIISILVIVLAFLGTSGIVASLAILQQS